MGKFNLSLQEQKRLDFLLSKLRTDEKVLEMKNYIQHGAISTYDHVEDVTRLCYLINKRLHIGADEKILVHGAFLHDFYLYDWHTDSEGLHGFYHPGIANRNAIKHFNIDENIQKIIKTHMWPLTITRVPASKEAWIVCLVDKYVSTRETILNRRKQRGKRYGN